MSVQQVGSAKKCCRPGGRSNVCGEGVDDGARAARTARAGLLAAVECLAERYEAAHGIPCSVSSASEVDAVGDDVETTTLNQVTRELLNNVAKHAEAARVDIELMQDADQLVLAVRDDGKSLDSSSARLGPGEDGGFGLSSIRERTRFLGGNMRVRSVGGTHVSVTVPVNG